MNLDSASARPGSAPFGPPRKRWTAAAITSLILSVLLLVLAPGLSYLGYLAVIDFVNDPPTFATAIAWGLRIWGVVALAEAVFVAMAAVAALGYLFTRKPSGPFILARRLSVAVIALGSVLALLGITVTFAMVADTPPGYRVLVLGMLSSVFILPAVLSPLLIWFNLLFLRRVPPRLPSR